MGSSCELKFDQISVISQKSFVPDEFVCLFQEGDRRTVESESDHDEDNNTVGYFAEHGVVLQRLDLLGYTAERARQHFEKWLSREREIYAEYEKEEQGEWAVETSKALRTLSYEDWLVRARDVLKTRYDFTRPMGEYKDRIDRRMRDLSNGWLFYDGNILPIIRSLLLACPDTREVSLDIGPLIGGGWIDAQDRICDLRRAPDLQPRSDLQPTVIIAEGSADMAILKRSLQKLYPYVTDYFTFFDYDTPKVDGGASYLVKFLRAFAAARINTNIIAIFDNDAAGTDAFNIARSVTLPTNITVMRLPDIELARAYPTRGPQGNHSVDINGRAVSIELFLGRHNLMRDDGGMTPVVWRNYVCGAREYHGVIDGKQKVIDRFMEETTRGESAAYYRSRFPELVTLWELIFHLRRDLPRVIELAEET